MISFSSESKFFVFPHCAWFMLQYCATFTFSRKIFFTKIKLSHNLQIQTDPKSFVKCIFCKKGCRTLNTKENAKNVKMHKNSSRKLKVAIQKLTFSKMGQYWQFYCLFEALSFIFLRKLNLVLVKKGALKALTKFTTIVTFFRQNGF